MWISRGTPPPPLAALRPAGPGLGRKGKRVMPLAHGSPEQPQVGRCPGWEAFLTAPVQTGRR